ncbi:AraC family transcriptional regulator [Lacticaseibacillus sp. GG6-2]
MLTHREIYQQLLSLSPEEQYQKSHPSPTPQPRDYYDQLQKRIVNGQEVYVFDDIGLIPPDQNFNLVQHKRFSMVPAHVHNFIELNYVYHGNCNQIIEDKPVHLKTGQICLIDTDVPHAIGNTGEHDIVIDIMVKKDYFIHELGQDPYAGGIVFDFVLDALSESQNHNQYIVFDNSQDQYISKVMDQILSEYFMPTIGSTKIIKNLISVLFTLLIRIFSYQTNKQHQESQSNIVMILKYIDEHSSNLSLSQLATHFNYNSSYISWLIKHETGHTFSQLQLASKLNHAENLLRNSDKSIRECAQDAGFKNITFFYKKYQAHFHHLPSQRKP